MNNIRETVLPTYINGQCPIIKTCSDVTFNLSSKDYINKLVCILFVHLSSISLEHFKDRALIIPEILELIKLHTYKYGLVYGGNSRK